MEKINLYMIILYANIEKMEFLELGATADLSFQIQSFLRMNLVSLHIDRTTP